MRDKLTSKFIVYAPMIGILVFSPKNIICLVSPLDYLSEFRL